jgi:hypothetical protein
MLCYQDGYVELLPPRVVSTARRFFYVAPASFSLLIVVEAAHGRHQ